MANDSRSDFHQRLKKIDKKPAKGNRATRSDRVGIYDYEEEKRRKAAKFPLGKLMFTILIGIVGLIFVKAFMVQKMGEEAYQARLTELRAGEGWEPYGAIVASRDPLMVMIEQMVFDYTADPAIAENAKVTEEAPASEAESAPQ